MEPCITIADNKIVSFIAGVVVTLVFIVGGWFAVHIGNA